MIYASKPQGVFSLFKNCFTAYPQILKQTWYLILISSGLWTLDDSITFLVSPHKDPTGSTLVFLSALTLLMFLITIFIYAIILHLANTSLLGTKPQLAESTANAKRRYLPLLGSTLLLMVLLLFIFLTPSIVSQLNMPNNTAKLITAIFYLIGFIVGLPLFAIYYFASTVIVIDQQSVFKSINICTKWLWQNKWRIGAASLLVSSSIFLLLLPVGFVIVLTPEKYSILINIIDFVLPLFTCTITVSPALVLLNDMKLRTAAVTSLGKKTQAM